MNLPRLKGQEGKPMIKEGRIMGERRVFTKEFIEGSKEEAGGGHDGLKTFTARGGEPVEPGV
jgi:hypothetical protein